MEQLLENERLYRINANLSLIQRKDGLNYGTDALLLAAYIKAKSNGKAVELGGGTGVISLLLAARNKFAHIDVLEIQQDFAELCRRNVTLNSLQDKISVYCRDVRKLNANELGAEVDAVFSNPPYMKAGTGKGNDSHAKTVARHEIEGGILDFCKCAARLLKFSGSFYCVWRPERLPDLICAMREAGLEPKELTFVCAEAEKAPSLLLCRASKGGSPTMAVTKPLIIYKSGTRDYTEAMKNVFDSGVII
jgi:tRNA1Val (adenine37-N6)-methyltransferase